MRIARIKIENFRGIESGELLLPENTILVGDNNTGKSTILEAIDLVLGPDRISRQAPIDEHDFHAGRYLTEGELPVKIKVEVVVVDLNEEQERHFRDHLEFWDTSSKSLLTGPPVEETNREHIIPALRLGFNGEYEDEEDDFVASTFFLHPVSDSGEFAPFKTHDKRLCGFLFLRTLRTGSRALSLERGSLLDIILRLQEKRLRMWEDVLAELRQLPVATKPELGITEILTSVQNALRQFVPSEWADNPHMRVSDLTRETLRRMLTVFMATGATGPDGSTYAAPFQHQGTGTINTLVLALLSLIADQKQNVIFAMEEPEIAIPPHTQKRIVNNVKAKSAQVLFTSHSPYVLEEFQPSQILVIKRDGSSLSGETADLPDSIKPKTYRSQFRMRFCEALLARRVLIAEGHTEYDAVPAAARRLHELKPNEFRTLEAMGIAIINAETDSQIVTLGEYFKRLGKVVFAIFDKQAPEKVVDIRGAVHHAYEAPEKGFERIILKGASEAALRRFAKTLVDDGRWPPHLKKISPTDAMPLEGLRKALFEYLCWQKADGNAARLLSECQAEEMPAFIVETLTAIQEVVTPPPPEPEQREAEASSPNHDE